MTVDQAIDKFIERIKNEPLEETQAIAVEMFGNMINVADKYFEGEARNKALSELSEGGILSPSEIADIAF